MGSQRVRRDLTTEQQQQQTNKIWAYKIQIESQFSFWNKVHVLICKAEMETHTQRTNVWIPTGKWAWDELRDWNWHTYTIDTIYKVNKHWIEFSVLCRKVKLLSCLQLLVTPWTAAYQAPLSMGFSRQEYWSGVPFPSPMHESEKWKQSRSVMSSS